MTYTQDIVGCLAAKIGDHGLSPAELDAVLARAVPALDSIRLRHKDGSLPLLHVAQRRDDIAAAKRALKGFRAGRRQRFRDVLILGTGGSSLGGQTLYALADPSKTPRLHFMDNIDPATFAALFASLDPARTGFIAISKSGGTAETLTQFTIGLDWLRQTVPADALTSHALAITEPKDNVLRRLCTRLGVTTLDHDPDIGGRYSVLSNVGLVPALLAGIDVAALRAGAAEVMDAVLAAQTPADAPPALGAALSVALAEHHAVAATVIMPYADRLGHFGLWFRQLWAESLGKDGKGTLPVRALGTVDQHSQLQLYLGGPRDKMFTIITTDVAGTGAIVPPDLASDPALAYLAGARMGDLLDAEQRATTATLIRNGRPTRLVHVPRLDAKSLGALLMHFMLETIVAAELLGVDAFDQPAVEEGKVLARQYLGERGAAKAQ